VSLFQFLDLETVSSCNRRCPTCLRNSIPDREAVASWFEPHYLEVDVIGEALDQAVRMGFSGGVWLSHYNEPLMDERIVEIAAEVRRHGKFKRVGFNTNGDYLTPELAAALDPVLDRIIITLYMDEPMKSERAAWMRTLFHHTEAQIITMSEHIPTHFSPKFDVVALAKAHAGHPCIEPAMRLIINHRRQYLLCCDDMIGIFNLGTFPEVPLAEHWNGVHAAIQARLAQPGGRAWHPHCLACPR
jgi:hypothetical protein